MNYTIFEDLLLQGHDIRFSTFGRSMAPFIVSGDRAIIRRVPVDRLIWGDILLCRVEGGGIVLHRLLHIRYASRSGPLLFTKGDALDIPDAPIRASEYLGKVIAVERADGRVRRLDNPGARFVNYIRALYQSSRSALVRGCLRWKRRFQSGSYEKVFLAERRKEARKDSLSFFFAPRRPGARMSVMTHNPRRFLYDLISGRRPVDPGFPGWSAVAAAACDEHVQGLLYLKVKDGPGPCPIRGQLESAYYATVAGNTFRMAALPLIDRALSRDKVSAIVIKGALLAHQFYEDPGMRPMEDIDLLVRPEQAGQAGEALRAAGFRRDGRFARTWRGNGIVIDLHHHLLHQDWIAGRETLFPIDPWRGAVPLGPGYASLLKPDPADHIFFLAHHLIKHSFSRLIWLIDLHRLLASADENFWIHFSEKAARFDQKRPVSYVLYLLHALFDYRPPSDVLALFGKVRLSPLERFILDLKCQQGNAGDLGNILWLFCLPDFRSRIRFVVRLLFPRPTPFAPGSFEGNRLRRIRDRVIHNMAAMFDRR